MDGQSLHYVNKCSIQCSSPSRCGRGSHRIEAFAPDKKAMGFYEAEFVKPRGEFSFLFSFWLSFIRIWQQFTPLALVLDRCGARHERRKDQTPKPVTLSSSQRN
jgi:hypothetical protein